MVRNGEVRLCGATVPKDALRGELLREVLGLVGHDVNQLLNLLKLLLRHFQLLKLLQLLRHDLEQLNDLRKHRRWISRRVAAFKCSAVEHAPYLASPV